ncbi:MAG: MFS transporter [Streptosporangiaceae bacterium]
MRSSGAGVLSQRRRQAWQPGDAAQLGFVTFSHAVQHIYVAALAISYPYVVADLHISYGTLGVLLGVAGLVGGLLQAAAGMVRRVPARLLLTAQNIGLATAMLLASVAPGFGMFSGARMLGAFTTWPQHPIGSAHLTARFPDRRGLVLSWHTTGGTIGTLSVPLVAEALFRGIGWRPGFVVFAGVMVLGAVLVMAGLRDRHARTRDTAAGPDRQDTLSEPAVPAGGEQPPPARLRTVFRRRTVILVLVASTIGAAGRGLGAITTYVPAYLQSDLHVGHLRIGAVVTAILAAGVIGPIVIGQLSDRLDRRAVLVIVYLAGAGALAGFVLVGATVPALAAVGLLIGVFAYSESPLLQSMFSDSIKGANSRAAFGVFFAIAYGVGSLWLTVLGQIIDHVGFQAAFFAMAGSFVTAACLIALSRPAPRAS